MPVYTCIGAMSNGERKGLRKQKTIKHKNVEERKKKRKDIPDND